MANNITESRHPAYLRGAAKWQLWHEAYLGGEGYVKKALKSHRLEKDKDLKDRQDRATLLNYLRPICDTYANYLFKPDDWTINVPASIDIVEKDADRRGHDVRNFFKAAVPLAAAQGFVIIGVDEPRVPDGVVVGNVAERNALGVRPYMFTTAPEDFLDWGTNQDGAITHALTRESIIKLVKGKQKVGWQFRFWLPDEITVLNDDGEPIDTVPNRAGVVPLVPLQFRDIGLPVVGQGLGQDLEPVQAHILNMSSLLSEMMRRQTFSQLVAQGSAEQYGDGADGLVRLGTSSIFLYPQEAAAPQFISPDASQASLLQVEMDRSIDEIYRLANLTRGTVREGQQASGISKAFDFLDTNQALSDVGRNVAATMQTALGFAAQWVGENPDVVVVSPPADYGITDLDGDITRLKELNAASASPALTLALEQRIARALAPGAEGEKLADGITAQVRLGE